MYDKVELQKKTGAELAKICKDAGIPHYRGKNRFRKGELIEAILGAEKSAEEATSAQDEVKIDDRVVTNDGFQVDMAKKLPYIERAEVGTFVAFRLPNGKVKSAKIIKKSTPRRRFMVETQYGATFIVGYNDIIWVRHSKRWPSGVYRLLKGKANNEARAN